MIPIIDPSTLSEEQREAIREEYNRNVMFEKKIDDSKQYWYSGANHTLKYLFGSEFFTNQKGE